MLTAFFTTAPVTNFPSALASDTKRYARFFTGMLDRGFNLAPSQYEAMFVSAAHTMADVDATVTAARDVLREIG